MPAKRLIVVLLCLGLFAGVASLVVWRNESGATRTEDRNHDGVPDVWTTNRGAGDSVVDIDTNFDGRPDVRLRYHDGNLVSREADSDFDDRVDIVEEFDPNTHEVFRSLFDIDKDGTADLLVLSHDGRSVFEEWATPEKVLGATPASAQPLDASTHGRSLLGLADPFATDFTVRGTRPWCEAQRDSLLATCGGLPQPVIAFSGLAPSERVTEHGPQSHSRLAIVQAAPRGPPTSSPTHPTLL